MKSKLQLGRGGSAAGEREKSRQSCNAVHPPACPEVEWTGRHPLALGCLQRKTWGSSTFVSMQVRADKCKSAQGWPLLACGHCPAASVPRQASLMQDLGWDASAQVQGHSRQNAPSRHQEAAPQIQSVGRELQARAGGAGRARASREESDG